MWCIYLFIYNCGVLFIYLNLLSWYSLSRYDWLSALCFNSVLFFFPSIIIFWCDWIVLELLCFISKIQSEQAQFDAVTGSVIELASSPLSCSMTSGKSGLWCDANLSCLRISTPQKPWSPTAELKTCWPLTMDSRSRHLPAYGSTAPSTLHSHGHLLCPGARVTLVTHVGLSIPPTMSLPRILSSSFLLPQCSSPVSASLRFLLSQVFFFIWRGESVCVCVSFSPRHIWCVLQSSPPSPSLHLTFLSPSIPLCTHCKCGIWEYGPHNTGFFIPSCKCVHNGLDMEI